MDQLGKVDEVSRRIIFIRNVQVMLDSDLAELYGVALKRLNEQVKRNQSRFPDEFCFQLNQEEFENLKSHFATSSGTHGGRRYLPYVFTEQGVAMLSAVLRSDTAVKVSVEIMKAFVSIRHFVRNNAVLLQEINQIKSDQVALRIETDRRFEKVFSALDAGKEPPRQGVFFEGQIFDAYTFVSKLIRRAKTSVVLIDNYVDDSVLTMLSKRRKGVSADIFCKRVSKSLRLDLEKHNAQYPLIGLVQFGAAHDRFLILDETIVYHIGASLKDLGKKWFAFSKIEKDALKVVDQLRGVVSCKENE